MNDQQWISYEQLPREQLETNLAVLNRCHPDLYPLFENRTPRFQVEVRGERPPFFACRLRTGQEWVPVHGHNLSAAEEHRRLQADVPSFWSWGGKLLYLYQPGLGFPAVESLQFLKQDPTRRLVVIQNELSPLLAGMALYDFRPLFESEQVFWILGPDAHEPLSEKILDYDIAKHVYFTITVGSILPNHRNYPKISEIVGKIRKVHTDYQVTRATTSLPEIKNYYEDHDLFQIKRVLAIDLYPDRAGAWILDAVAGAMRQLGLEVCTSAESARHGDSNIFKNHIFRLIAETKPDLVFTIMFCSCDYLPQEAFDSLRLLRINYQIDQELPLWAKSNKHELAILTMKEMTGIFESHTGIETDFLPIVPRLERSGQFIESLEVPLSFVGGITSMPWGYLSARRMEMERCHPGLWGVVENLVQKIARCERSATIYQIVDEAVRDFDPPLSDQERWEILLLANRLGSDLYRRRLLTQVAQFQPWIFAGDSVELEPNSPFRPFIKGRIEPDLLPDLYASSAINLNIHSPGNTHTPSDRVFNVARAGGFQLCDPLQNLSDFYRVPEEIPIYTSEEDLVNKILHYLNRPAERREAAEMSRKRTEEQYTYNRWVHRLFSIIQRRLRERFDKTRRLELPFELEEGDLG
ncbi:MAG: glycosyltransferase [bacterium]